MNELVLIYQHYKTLIITS